MQFVVEPHLFLFYMHLYVFICICLCLGICLRQVRASTDAIHGGIRKAGPDLTLGAPRIKHSFCLSFSVYLYFHPCSFHICFACSIYLFGEDMKPGRFSFFALVTAIEGALRIKA